MESPAAKLPAKRALVVEGNAMRGIFSAGVLDSFLDPQYRSFDFCLGVSAGSTNLAAWLANQRGRNCKVITDYFCRPQCICLKNFSLVVIGSISIGCGTSRSRRSALTLRLSLTSLSRCISLPPKCRPGVLFISKQLRRILNNL